ncbi:mechanosensitive ion channel family protein [Pseudoclavibacter sp. RFBA6]|uniref:mechanosensitive ion channel family protein n=1 Tax=Pseudoclavibacter sp. RFBA6 TaxID=2080573 RepID=UPI000CE791F3|nr:mechanosensitive ion channel domain-containing protein [Pseudoclavibacter sp. RFBA6]PPG40061.1 mechanosensitive ion channel protein MscS [Pseudoclavibacter sp. RFBA6]
MAEFWTSLTTALAPFDVPITIVFYILGAFVFRWILLKLIDRSVKQIVSGVKKKRGVTDTQALSVRSPLAAVRTVQRTRTIGSVLTNIVNVVVVVILIVMIIAKIDPGILASLSILSAAVGAGLGFGAQRIVGDVLNGLFMVMEDQLGVGDVIDMGEATGVVEKVGVRITQIRDVEGTLWFVRNGEIQRVGSFSQGWNRIVFDLAVPYETSRAHVERVMLQAAKELTEDPDWMDYFIGTPEMWGMESISSDAVVLRLTIRVRPGTRWEVERELRARTQDALKSADINLPSLKAIVLDGADGQPTPGGTA